MARPGGVLLPSGVGFLPFQVGVGEEGMRREGGRKGGPTPSQVLIQLGKGGVLLPMGVGLLLARLSHWPAEPPLLLYIRGQGGTSRHN